MRYNKLDIDEKIMLKNKIPLLIEDESWISLFGDTSNREIKKAKEELSKLVEENKKLERRSNKLQKEKLNSMKMILGVSDAVNNENNLEVVGLLEEYREKIEDINEELEEITFQLEIMPESIRKLNFDLLESTVYYGYKELKEKQRKLDETIDEIDSLKERLKILINEKYNYEEWVGPTYSFLHGMLGNEEMEKLDGKIL